jgi:voltage-gated potassium channel
MEEFGESGRRIRLRLLMVHRLTARLFGSPLIRRVRFYARRVSSQLDRRFFVSLVEGILVIVAIAAVLITLIEKPITLGSFGESFYWGLTTVLGQGQASFVHSPAGWFISWLLILFGVALFGTITGALIAVVIDFLLKEGQGMGASGYEDHVVVCGWNTTARDLIAELRSDVYKRKIVLIAQVDKNPAGEGVYYVKGDSTETADLERAGIGEAASAIVFSDDDSNEGDMHSILTVMAIKAIAPRVRTVVEVNNPRHVEHLRRAKADEILVSSQLASRLMARSALYPGLTELVTDIVYGGEGSELYRIAIPAEYLGLTLDEVSARLRADHRATLLSISRGGRAFVNPPADFRIEGGDDAVVVAESLGTLAPLVIRHEENGPSASTAGPAETSGNGLGPAAHAAPTVASVAPVDAPGLDGPSGPSVAGPVAAAAAIARVEASGSMTGPVAPPADKAGPTEPVARIATIETAPAPSAPVASVTPTTAAPPTAVATAIPQAPPTVVTAPSEPVPGLAPTVVAAQASVGSVATAVGEPTIVVSRPVVPGGPTIVTISPAPRPEAPQAVVGVGPLEAGPQPVPTPAAQLEPAQPQPTEAVVVPDPDGAARDGRRASGKRKKKHARK